MNYIAIKSDNIPVFGISKSKTLSDFVTTESDVKKGTNRLPLKLARIYDEDLMSEEEVQKRQAQQKMEGLNISKPNDEGADDLLKNIEHKHEAYKRKS